MDKSLAALRRRLEKMELEHLRQHALELHERLGRAEEAARRADETAEYWRESYMQLQEAFYDENFATARCIGLTRDGELLVVKDEPLTAGERDPYTLPLFPELVAHA